MHKLHLYRIKAESPEFACEKANELLNPEKENNLSEEEQFFLARVIKILAKLDEVLKKEEFHYHLNVIDVNEEKKYSFLKQNLKIIDDNTPLKGVTGGTIPAEIWYETMKVIINQSRPGPLPMMRKKPAVTNSLETAKKKQNSLTENRIFGAIWDILIGKN